MADTRILLKKSGIKGKTPAPADAEFGELFLNYHSGDPMLCFKDNAGEIVQIKPTKVIDGGGGEVPPTVDVEIGDTLWDGTYLLVWDGSEWVQIGPQDYWDRTGTTLSPATAGDSVDIGSGNISLNADGSGVVKGTNVEIGSNPLQPGNSGMRLNKSGSVAVNRSDTNTYPVWQGHFNNSETSTIRADGSATFAGNVGIGTQSPGANLEVRPASGQSLVSVRSSSDNALLSIRSGNSSQSLIRLGRQDDSDVCSIAYDHNNNDLNFRVNSLDALHIDSARNVKVIGTGTVAAPNITLNADGSAEFAGNITAANVTFDAGTPEEFSVKERLAAARETFQELQIAVSSATDFASLKAAMLVALEDWQA